ncbi:MAG: sugar transferase [Planctomycetota bacterium]|nr:MAG: sugar transferase [Planctomycetota bacterium]
MLVPEALCPAASHRSAVNVALRPVPVWKRCMDIVGAGSALVLLAPLLLAIAAYIRVVSGRPVFFRQPRLGGGTRPFTIWKFRTLATNRPVEQHRQYVRSLMADEQAAAKPDLQRDLIPGGAFLRRYSLDELPQLFNVLRGDMSLVGPRPDVLELEQYEPWQLRRFEVTPGITGLWQVSGKNRLPFRRMIELDIEYAERRNIWLDILILIKTLRAVVSSDNQ